MPEPLTLAAAVGIGAAWRIRSDRKRGVDRKRDKARRRDKGSDRVLPASWDQLADIDGLAHTVAQRDGRDPDHVLIQYGAYTYNRGKTRTMTRKNLTRREALDIAARIRKDENVRNVAPPSESERERFSRAPKRADEARYERMLAKYAEIEEPRDDEEAF